jgi:hypothetical protein
MKLPEVKAMGGDAVALIQRVSKDPSKLPKEMLDAEKEYAVLKGAQAFLSKELGKPVVVQRAGEGHDPAKKSRAALPGKPAIYFE